MAKMTTNSVIFKLGVFSVEDVMRVMNMSRPAAAMSLIRWQRSGYVRMIRRGMYVTIDMLSDRPSADKYEIASSIGKNTYVGWHTAFEFHGVAHQPFYNVFVGSDVRFKNFSFDNIDYEYCNTTVPEIGVATPLGNPNVRVTDLERTVVDCCDRLDRAGGAEELMHCMESIVMLDGKKLITYLEAYNKVFLYQKVGFFLERCFKQDKSMAEIIELCRKRGAIFNKKIDDVDVVYVKEWKLYVPRVIAKTTEDGII